MRMKTNFEIAEVIWSAIYRDLHGRSGIGNALDDVDSEAAAQMQSDMVGIILSELDEQWPHGTPHE